MKLQLSDNTHERGALVDALDVAFSRLTPLAGDSFRHGSEEVVSRAIGELELSSILVPAPKGGLGMDAIEAILACYLAGYHCVPLPIKELIWAHGLVGQYSPNRENLESRAGKLAVASPLRSFSFADVNRNSQSQMLGAAGNTTSRQLVMLDCAYKSARTTVNVFQLEASDMALSVVPPIGERSPHIKISVPVDRKPLMKLDLPLEVIERYRRLWQILCGAELAGAAHRALEFSLEYVCTRVQFGSPVGSRQALQHLLVDDYIRRENLCIVVEAAAVAWSHADDRDQLEAVATMLGQVIEARQVIEGAIQYHGGIGFTRELPLHHLLGRAMALMPDMSRSHSSELLYRELINKQQMS